MSLNELTAWDAAEQVRSGAVSARELTEAALRRIDALDGRVRAFLQTLPEQALAQADAVDRKRAAGDPMGRLAGVPVALKDNLCLVGSRTTCASKILADFEPPYNAHVVERLLAEDAVIVGKTNLDEFAMGSSTENSAFGPTRNPWNLERTPGGSSGGSAAAAAAGMALLALGSDTGGSIRQPAAFCGVVGMKPTYGRVSRYGLVAFASSLDQIGPFARDARDAALLLEVIAAPDERDSTCVSQPPPPYSRLVDQPVDDLRIGVPREFFGEGLQPEVAAALEEAIRIYERLGAKIVEVSLPHSRIDREGDTLTSYAVATYYIVATAEASSNLARYDGMHYGYRAADSADLVDAYSRSRAEGFGEEVKRRIMLGTFALSSGFYDAYYLKASKVRSLFRRDFDAAFEQATCLLGPTAPSPAFAFGEKTANPLEMYLCDIYTISANLAGVPALSLPCGFSREGLPIGMQLIGRPHDDATLLQVARLFERETDYSRRRPALD